jgi:transposase-like protein
MATRTQHSAKFKVKVALEAIKATDTTAVLAARYGVHPTMIARWKKELIERAEEAFSCKHQRREQQAESKQAELFEQIGRLKMELEWLKKKSAQLG